MRILFLDPADFIGGAELFQRELLQDLPHNTEGIFITSEKNIFPLPKNIRAIHISLPRLRPFRPLLFFTTILHLRKIVRENSLQIVHSNSVRSGIFAAFLGIPWTHFAHDFTTPRFLASLFRRAKYIFCCSEIVCEDIVHKKASLHTKRRGVVPPLFFEKSEYERIQKIRQKKVYFPHFRVSLVGRIDTWKGQDILLEIAKKCQEDGIQNIHFSFFGTSSSYDPKTVMFEKSLHNFAKENNLTNVSFHGYCEPETIFSETNLLIHASTEHEPFGRTIAEAALIGIPIIASRFSGAAPYFSSLPYVRLIENPRNIEEVFALIVKAKEDFSAGPRFFLEGKELWKYFQDGRIRMTEIWQNTILPQRSPDKS